VEVDDDNDLRRPTRRPAHLVFRGGNGEPVNASTFSRTWTPVRTKVGLPRWGFHGLRHYYATLLIHAGASVKTVQLALGHSTPTITLNQYVHEWPDGRAGPHPRAGRRRSGRTRNGGHVGWEPSMTAVFYVVPRVVPKIRTVSIRAGHGTARGQTL
jgi:hypothetical protein